MANAMANCEIRRPQVASWILVVGAIIHALLCGPAIDCRGYPPIPPIWYGVTFIWPVAVLISAYFDSTWFGTRRDQLIIYSLVTAFFTAGTLVIVVPRQVGLSQMLACTLFIGPLHLLVTFVTEYASQFIYAFGRELVENRDGPSRSSFSLFSFLALIGWIALILGIPTGYQALAESSLNNDAIQHADSAWETDAFIFGEFPYESIGDVNVEYYFDARTGLEYRHQFLDGEYVDRYNARIRQLVELRGIPHYSIKDAIPDPNDVALLLDANDLVAVENLPMDVTENIHLMCRGYLTRWGKTIVNSGAPLSIVTPHTQTGRRGSVQSVHYKITEHVVYVRTGSNWVGVYLHDGRMIMSASRNQ